MNTLNILFDLAEQQPELSSDFLNEALKQTNKTENEFWKELCNSWQFLANEANGLNRESLADNLTRVGIIGYLRFRNGINNTIYSTNGLTREGLRITFNHLTNYALENRLIWYYYSFEGKPFEITYDSSPLKLYGVYRAESERQFKNEFKSKKPGQIGDWLNIHLRKFVREGGNKTDWIKHTKQFVNLLSIEQQDSFYNWVDANSIELHPLQTGQEIIETKPALKPEAVLIVFEIIKDFFSPDQQDELKQVIGTGNKATKKLLFKGNGNRLTDTFKKLIEHDFIIGCQKQDLIFWVIKNFTFICQKSEREFIYDTVEKTISRNDNPCKSPLIVIENGEIQKVEQPRTKKYDKY